MTGRKILLLVLLAALALPPFAGINSYWLHVLNVAWILAIAPKEFPSLMRWRWAGKKGE